jgi:hypothetical protein
MTLEDNKAVSLKFMQCFDRRDLEGCRAPAPAPEARHA